MNNGKVVDADQAWFYAAVGPQLIQFDVDIKNGILTKGRSIDLPENIQYVWQHASKQFLYAACSNGGPGASGIVGDRHYLCAVRIETESGAMTLHGEPVKLAHRPLHITTDIPSHYVLTTYNRPSGWSVHKINHDGTVGVEIAQPQPLDAGIFAHQIRVMPTNTSVILVTRGNQAAAQKPEEPGALKVFNYRDGVLSDATTIAPGNGYGFGPRHLDFHPTQSWVYVSLERQNKLCLFKREGDVLSALPSYSKDMLAQSGNVHADQLGSTVHVHPNGRSVYTAERATRDQHGTAVNMHSGGENTIVAYAIDQRNGEPNLIQFINTRGMHPRTFSIDPGGRVLIVGNKSPVVIQGSEDAPPIAASLDVFHIGEDGMLTFISKHDLDVGENSVFWSGFFKR